MINLTQAPTEAIIDDLSRLESAPIHLLPWRALERGLRDTLITAYKAELAKRSVLA